MDEKERWYESYPPTQGNERDTHFKGFAELLVLQFDGLSVRYKDWPDWRELDRQMKLVISQRAYDLVEHVIKNVNGIDLYHTNTDTGPYGPGHNSTYTELLADVPDLTAWPTSPEPRLFDPSSWPTSKPPEP